MAGSVSFLKGTPKAQAPTTINSLVLVEGTTLKGIVSPTSPKFEILGVLMGNVDLDTLIIAEAVIACESGGKHEGVWGDRGKAYGIAQFWEETFYWMADLAGIENPYWKNQEQQVYLLGWALENGLGSHWTCYRTLNN